MPLEKITSFLLFETLNPDILCNPLLFLMQSMDAADVSVQCQVFGKAESREGQVTSIVYSCPWWSWKLGIPLCKVNPDADLVAKLWAFLEGSWFVLSQCPVASASTSNTRPARVLRDNRSKQQSYPKLSRKMCLYYSLWESSPVPSLVNWMLPALLGSHRLVLLSKSRWLARTLPTIKAQG